MCRYGASARSCLLKICLGIPIHSDGMALLTQGS